MVQRTPERPARDSSVSSWPSRQPGQAASPAQAAPSPSASPLVSPGVSPASAGRRSPRKSARPVRTPQFAVEDDPVVLARRQKQIEYGKNTLAYQQYTAAVPSGQRLGYHPRTPVKRRVQSRRRWDNAVKCWRVHLHYWNDPSKLSELRGLESASDSSSVVSDLAERDPAPAEGAAGGTEEGKAATTEEAVMEEGAAAATGAEEAQGDDLNWADDVEGLAMEFA